MSRLFYFLSLALLLTACTKKPVVPPVDTPTPPVTTPEDKPDPTPNLPESTSKTTLGITSSLAKSKNAADAVGVAQSNVNMAAVSFDSSGKITSAFIDTLESKVEFDKTGKITSPLTDIPKTKKQLGDAYGMKKASSIGKEWWEQMEAFEKYAVGKTVAELQAMPVKERDATHKYVPDVPELVSSVTISIEEYVAAIAAAEVNSKK